MPRHDKKAYTTLTARMPQDLVDQVQQYAQQHRCTVAELLRDGLVMRLESGDVPGRSTPQHPAPDAEVRPEVRPEVIREVLHTLEPRIQVWIQAAIQQTISEVRHGQTSHPPLTPPGQTEVIPHEQAAIVPLVPTIPHPPPSGQTKGRPDKASPAQPTGEGQTKGRPHGAMPVSSAFEVRHDQTSAPAESPPSTGGQTEVRPLAVPADPPTDGGQTSGRPPPEAQAPPRYDPTKFTLGKLCRAGHAYGSTGQTLRRRANNNCVACNEAQQRARRAAKKAPQRG